MLGSAMPTQIELNAFERWALQRYTPRSVHKLVADIRTMVRTKGEPPAAQRRAQRIRDYAWAWDVWGDCRADGVVLPELPLSRPVPPPAPKRGGRRGREPKRVLEARSMTSEEYERVVEALAADPHPAARLVEVMARTGLRYADVARVGLAALRAALRTKQTLVIRVKGDKEARIDLEPALDAWQAIDTLGRGIPGAVRVADVATGRRDSDPEADGAAYQRCVRIIKKHGAASAVDGRVHLHRLRRTVGNELLRRGASMEDVQQVFIHDSVETTERSYADEHRAEQARRALGLLKRRDE